MKISSRSSVELSNAEEDLILGADVRITCIGAASALIVKGEIVCEGEAVFLGNVECEDFEASDGTINIEGSLKCKDLNVKRNAELRASTDIQADDVEVDRALYVGGTIFANEIEVGGKFETTSVHADSVSVGGVFAAKGDVEVKEIEVGGKLEIIGKISSHELSVGGKAALHGGGAVSGEIEVGGVLTVEAPLEFGNLEVGGTAGLRGSAKGKDIDIGGTIDVDGDLSFEDMDVVGLANIKGSATGTSIDIGGRLVIRNSLRLSGDLDIGGSIEIGGKAEVGNADIGGEFRADCLVVRDLDLGGGAKTDKGIFASGDVRVGHRSKVKGWIRAQKEIELDSRSEVESVAAPKVSIDDHCRVVNAYAEEIEIGDRVEISEEVLYIRSINLGDNVRFAFQPQKVSSIPLEKSWTQVPS